MPKVIRSKKVKTLDDGNGLTVYGSDGCLYNFALRGKGKSSGQGDSGKGTTFNGQLFLVRAVRTHRAFAE